VKENTTEASLSKEEKAKLDDIINSFSVHGGRYNEQIEPTLWG
jgi:hypothetical protein